MALSAAAAASIGAAVIGAGGSMGTAAVNGGKGKKSQARQFRYNSQMQYQGTEQSLGLMRAQQYLNKKMYDYTYDKESYASQIKQMKAAGINPGLMYGGAPGVGGTTASVGASAPGGAGVGMYVPEIGDMSQGMGMALQTLADLKLKEAQTNNINADTQNKEGIDRDVASAQIQKLIAETDNVQLKNIYQNLDNQIKDIELETQSMTMEARIRATTAKFQQAQEEAIQAILKTGVDEATQKDKIQQMKNATQASFIDLIAKKAGVHLTEEQTKKLQQEILNLVNDVEVKNQEVAIKKKLQEFQTSDAQLYKVYSEIFRNGASGVQQIGSLFKIGGSNITNTYNNQKINSETNVYE